MKKEKTHWKNHIIELFVVFLGVTASFILLNISENRSDRKMEQKYIEGFHTDVNENIRLLKEQISSDSLWVENYSYALPLIINNHLSKDSANTLMYGLANFSRFAAQQSTYINLMNSGSLGLIRDYQLRQELVKYHKSIDDAGILEDYFEDHGKQNFIPFLIKNYNIFLQKFPDEKSYSVTEFYNLFGTHFSFTQQRLELYNELLLESIEIQNMLKNF